LESSDATVGLIYFVQGKDETPVKIGYTANVSTVARRIANLQVAHPYPLRAIATFRGSMSDERCIHRELQADRLLGEWFEWTPRLVAFIQTLQRSGNLDVALGTSRSMETAQHQSDNLLTESRVAATFGYPAHWLRTARRAGAGPVFVERQVGKRLERLYRIGDFRAWLTAQGRVRQNIDWGAAGGEPGTRW
jgi:hypothetical protein